ncbi:MAG: nicotinate phosphoribosyltransferase [Candidatus Omnitrophica bacterium]|nr:nicotinate phosphoribosyltransferase [Candidatus Omnitrophota bacterium]
MNGREKGLAEGILYTDFYQLTMAQLYFRAGLHEKPVQFEYFFRNYPAYDSHQAGYCIHAGLEWLVNWMCQVRVTSKETEYLRQQTGRGGKPLFQDDFLEWLEDQGDFSRLSLQAVPEGRVVHPNVPLAVVNGPCAMAQILESSLLNHLNYQTLIATKASRIRDASSGGLVIDFGMRRGQGLGANAGARAALIGGARFSSNTGLSSVMGVPPKGTHAHSMVQAFMALGQGELGAFRAYAAVYPDDCLLLVDTIDTLGSGVPNAITVFRELRKKGHQPFGIRLDSGDLAYLSIQAAKMLDDAGFPDTTIVLSNKLDELVIWQIVSQIRKESPRYGIDPEKLISRLAYGVGTRLITSQGDAALDGVYKLTAVQDQGEWVPAIKLSESIGKIINPGDKGVWRVYDQREEATADLICRGDEDPRKESSLTLCHPTDPSVRRTVPRERISSLEPLLVDVLKEGNLVYEFPSLEQIRKRRDADLARLDSGVKRLINPHRYHISLSRRLWELKEKLIQEQRSSK